VAAKAKKPVPKVVNTTVQAAAALPGSNMVKATVQGVLGLNGERMSKVDTAWLRMDSKSNLMVIVGVWLLKPRITYEALCERVTDRLLPFPRFTQMAIEDAAGATWVQDPNFKLERHVLRETLLPPESDSTGSSTANGAGKRSKTKKNAAPTLDSSRAKALLQQKLPHCLWRLWIAVIRCGNSISLKILTVVQR
jgi:hypothetical protein